MAEQNNNKLFSNTGNPRLLIERGTNSPYNDKYEDVVIIQSMLTGEKYVMCEIVKLKGYLDVGED